MERHRPGGAARLLKLLYTCLELGDGIFKHLCARSTLTISVLAIIWAVGPAALAANWASTITFLRRGIDRDQQDHNDWEEVIDHFATPAERSGVRSGQSTASGGTAPAIQARLSALKGSRAASPWRCRRVHVLQVESMMNMEELMKYWVYAILIYLSRLIESEYLKQNTAMTR